MCWMIWHQKGRYKQEVALNTYGIQHTNLILDDSAVRYVDGEGMMTCCLPMSISMTRKNRLSDIFKTKLSNAFLCMLVQITFTENSVTSKKIFRHFQVFQTCLKCMSTNYQRVYNNSFSYRYMSEMTAWLLASKTSWGKCLNAKVFVVKLYIWWT